MKMTRCSIACLLIICYIGRLPGGDWRHLAVSAACPEPSPVANAVRTVSQENGGVSTANYTCVDGYKFTAGSLTRHCNSTTSPAAFEQQPPVCTLDCGAHRQVAVTTSAATGTLANSVAEYWCNEPYRPKKENKTQACDPVTAQWAKDDKTFCKMYLDLTGAAVTQYPDLDPGDSTSEQLVIDKNVSTCGETGRSNHPSWTVEFSKGDKFDIISVEFVMKMSDAALTNMSLRADVTGGGRDACGRHNQTKATLVNGTLNAIISCSGRVKPFGTHVTLTALFDEAGVVNGSLELCDVKIKGGHHTPYCNFPPRIPRLKLITAGQTTFWKTDIVRYECEDQYTPFSGSGNSTCELDAEWTVPSLVCIDDQVILDATLPTDPPHTTSPVNVPLDLSGAFEILGIYLADVTQASSSVEDSVSVSLGSPPQTAKKCDGVNYSDDGVFVTCLYRPMSSRVTLTMPLALYTAISAIKVLGAARVNGALECLLSAKGEEYKGMLNYSHSGLPCLAWSDFSSSYTADDFPDASVEAASNRCRNPTVSRQSPWCYVLDTDGLQQQDCVLLLCNQFCKVKANGRDYVGSKQTTKRGKNCQKWSSLAQPFVRPLDFPNGTKNHSECRNPADSQSSPWCIVKKIRSKDIEGSFVFQGSTLYYDLCDVPMCPTSINIMFIQQSKAQNMSALYDSNATVWECHDGGTWHSTYVSLVLFVDAACHSRAVDVTEPPANLSALCQTKRVSRLASRNSTLSEWTHFIVQCDELTSSVTILPSTLYTSPLGSMITSDWSYNTQAWTTTVGGTLWSGSLESSEPFSLSSHWSETGLETLSSSAQSTSHSSLLLSDLSPSDVNSVAFTTQLYPSTPESSSGSDMSLTHYFGSQSSTSDFLFSSYQHSPGISVEPESSHWSSYIQPTSTAAVSSSVESPASMSGQPSSSHQLSQTISTTSGDWSDNVLSSSTYSQTFSIQSTTSSDWSSNNDATGSTLTSMTAKSSDPPPAASTSAFPTTFSASSFDTTMNPTGTSSVPFLCPQKCQCQTKTQGPLESSVVESITSSIRKELAVDTHNLSRTVRKKTSAPDNRVSAVTIGSFGVILLISTFLLIVASDILQGTRGGFGRQP